jgi:hypothetical protein
MMFLDWVNLQTSRERGGRNERTKVAIEMCEPPHDIQHRCFSDPRNLSLRQDNGRVSSHQEVASRSWNERGHETDEIVVHVAGVAKGRCGGCHHSGDK